MPQDYWDMKLVDLVIGLTIFLAGVFFYISALFYKKRNYGFKIYKTKDKTKTLNIGHSAITTGVTATKDFQQGEALYLDPDNPGHLIGACSYSDDYSGFGKPEQNLQVDKYGKAKWVDIVYEKGGTNGKTN